MATTSWAAERRCVDFFAPRLWEMCQGVGGRNGKSGMEFVSGFAVGAVVLGFAWLRSSAICAAVVRFFGLQDRDPKGAG